MAAPKIVQGAKNEVISADEMYFAPRGRKADVVPGLADDLKSLKAGQALVLRVFGKVEKENRSKVSQSIRSHWKIARGGKDLPQIAFNAEGVPQVKPKAKA